MWQVVDSPAVIPIYHNSKSATSHTPCCQTNMLKQLATIFQDWMILKKCVCFKFIFYIFDCWLCTWGRYGILVWNIGGDRRHTPTIVPTTHQIHYPVTTKNTFRKVLNVKIVHTEQGSFCPPKNCSGIYSPSHPVSMVVQSPNIISLSVGDSLSLVCLD